MGQTKPARRPDPFGEAPDTQFYWSGPARSTPLAEVEAAIERGNLAIACAGAPGSGRSLFLYRLAERLAAAGARFIHPDRVVACKAREAVGHVPKAWQGDSQRKGGKGAAVLILDDVDQLSRAEMAQLRDWWTSLREKPEKVALVVSCTASAVDPDSGSRRQDLRAMIDAVAALHPLAPADIEEMIRFRLEVAGWEWENVFTQPALEKIAFYAKGTPKRLVQICARVMTLAEESGGFPAGPELVKEAAHQLFLPSHLREFSKQISLGLVPIPGLLNESAPNVSPASSPASDTASAHDVLQEPRARPADDPAAAWLQRQNSGLPDPVQPHEPVRHDGKAVARDQLENDSEQDQDPGVQATSRGIAPVGTKRRRLRGTVGVVAVCGMAVAAGVIGYVLGQVDMKPMEVVRIIPQPQPLGLEGGTDAGGSLPPEDDRVAPSSPSETAPTPEIAPAPQAVSPPPESAPAPNVVPAPQAVAPPPEIAPVPDVVPVPETAPPTRETAPSPEAVPVPEIADGMPAVVPPPTGESMPEVAAEPVEPEPSEAFAEAEAEGEALPADASPSDAADMAGEEQEAQASEFFFDWTPPSFAHLSTPGGEDGVDDAGSNDDAGSGRTSAATQGAETERASTSAIFSAEDKPEAASNDQSGVGSAERGEVRASVPAVEEPVVRLQRDPVVMRAQTLLTQLDFYRAGIDGLLGERTIAAIRDFQKSMSMAETGEVSEALLEALEAQASAARSDISAGPREQSAEDAAVEAAEMLQVIDIMDECRGKEAEWIYIAAINRHVLCGGLSAGSPN